MSKRVGSRRCGAQERRGGKGGRAASQQLLQWLPQLGLQRRNAAACAALARWLRRGTNLRLGASAGGSCTCCRTAQIVKGPGCAPFEQWLARRWGGKMKAGVGRTVGRGCRAQLTIGVDEHGLSRHGGLQWVDHAHTLQQAHEQSRGTRRSEQAHVRVGLARSACAALPGICVGGGQIPMPQAQAAVSSVQNDRIHGVNCINTA